VDGAAESSASPPVISDHNPYNIQSVYNQVMIMMMMMMKMKMIMKKKIPSLVLVKLSKMKWCNKST
jgi:hypothetical protein